MIFTLFQKFRNFFKFKRNRRRQAEKNIRRMKEKVRLLKVRERYFKSLILKGEQPPWYFVKDLGDIEQEIAALEFDIHKEKNYAKLPDF